MTTWDSLSDLCSLQCRIRTEQSIILQRRQKEILKWLSNLSDDQLALCLALDITPILKEVSAILQFLLISEPHSLEQVCLFQWAIVKGGVHIERSKSGKISQDTESLRSDQIDILNQIRVVWEGTNLIDLRFSNKQILKLMLRVSQGQCLTRLPDQEGPYGLMWLRIKTRFSLAELFVALLEIRIWKFWKKGICHELSSTAETKRKLLLEMVKSVPNIHLTIEKAGAEVLSTLVVDNSLKNKSVSGAEVIPLYLQIMKQRLLRCWYDPLLDTTPYRVPFKNLWILSHLISISHHFKFHEGSNVSLLSPLIESIVSIPLLHSFTFYHEYKMRVREKLLSDYASSTLLIAEINSVPQKKNDKSKKKKKKTRKSKVSLPMKSVSPKSRTPSPLFVCLTTDEVTPNLIHSTTAFSHCVSILNSIIDNALEFIQVVDASTDVKVKFTDSDDNVVSEYSDTFEESSLSSVLHVKGNIQVPWMFEEWGLPIFPEGLPQNNQQQEGTLYFDDTEESTMSWIRNHLPHGIFDGAYEVSEVISDCREPQIPKFVYSENKSLKYECSSLPTSPKTNDNASPTLNHIGGRNERAWSFTEALRSADKVDTLSPRVGRRRADSLDPSHHHTPPRIVSLEPQIGVSTLPSTSSLVDSDQCHFMRFPKIEANFLSQDPSQEINTDEDNSFDDTFHDNDSRLSFGIWSQEVEPDISDTSKCKVPPDLVALSCSLLRSHADTIALRNIIALQQSFIIQPQNQFMLAPITTSNGLYIPLSYYPGNSLAGYGNIDFRGHQARELDVMSRSFA